MIPFAYFGIESSGLNLAIDLLILFVAVLYLSLIYWTYADARRRILDPMLVGCATAASLFPFVGTIVYMILRPAEYLDDVRERELEMQAAEARLHELDYGLCPHCDYRIERDFLRCPSCLRKLKERCASCARPLDRSWTICPYCEMEVSSGPSVSPRTRRRRANALENDATELAEPALEHNRTDIDVQPGSRRDEEDALTAAPVAAEPLPRTRAGRTGRRPRPTS
jgi:hypothetical protein